MHAPTEQTRPAVYRVLASQSESWTAVKAKLEGRLQAKGKDLSARIQLQAARGEGIRMSVYFLLFEVARVWFTPTEVVFVDLVNGKYAQEAYPRFGERLGVTLDYGQIEQLIMGGVFAPGKGASSAALESLRYTPKAGGLHQLSGAVLGYNYSFNLSPEMILKSVLAEDSKGRKVFDAVYTSEARSGLPVLTAPAISAYSVYSTSSGQSSAEARRGLLELEWQNVQILDNREGVAVKPIIKDKYERLDLGTILKVLQQ